MPYRLWMYSARQYKGMDHHHSIKVERKAVGQSKSNTDDNTKQNSTRQPWKNLVIANGHQLN